MAETTQERAERVDLFMRMLDADEGYQAADEACRAFHASEAGRALTAHFMASGGWISTFPDEDVIARHHAHEDNRQREFDRVVRAFFGPVQAQR